MISVKGNLTGKLNTTYTKIYPELENLTVTPSEEQQKFIHEDRYGYDKVVVNPIPDKYIIPSGSLDITENGNYNVKEKEFAKVNVPTKTLGTKTITTNGTYLATDDGIDGYSEVNVETSGVNIWDYFKEECTYDKISKCITKIPPITLSNVTSLENMFYEYLSLTSLDLSNFDTSNVTNMDQMFYGCSSLTSLDLSNFDTSNVTSMKQMFWSCRELTSLDLSNFNTSKVKYMDYMFSNCEKLTNLNISNFDFTNVTSYLIMFSGVPSDCYILVKDTTAKEWITSKFTNLTNVHYVGEIE